MDKKWYVVHTYSGHENKVKTNLEQRDPFRRAGRAVRQILVATEDYVEMKDGKRKISKRKTFPSYVMIEMALDDETRHLVQNVPGVTRFIGSGQSASPQGERGAARPRADGAGEVEAGADRDVPHR
jgi:transcriptional antiterminator NusG